MTEKTQQWKWGGVKAPDGEKVGQGPLNCFKGV